MQLRLKFADSLVTGTGIDDIAPFHIRGTCDAVNLECYWLKTYPGSHDVAYRGFREGKGIWGTWNIRHLSQGGFHIWPIGGEEAATSTRTEEVSTWVETQRKGTRVATPALSVSLHPA